MKRLEFGSKHVAPKTAAFCAGCNREIDGRTIYCGTCAEQAEDRQDKVRGGLRFGRFVFKEGTRRLSLSRPLLPRCDAHFAEIEWMVRNRCGRAVLSKQHVRWHEARVASRRSRKPARRTQMARDTRPPAGVTQMAVSL